MIIPLPVNFVLRIAISAVMIARGGSHSANLESINGQVFAVELIIDLASLIAFAVLGTQFTEPRDPPDGE